MKVPTKEIEEALAYFGIPMTETLQKSMESKSLDGSEQNGGGSEPNDLEKKKSELTSKVEKAKKDLADLEKEKEEFEKSCGMNPLKKGEDGSEKKETEPSMPEEKKEELEKSKKEISELSLSVSHLTSLVKSQHSSIENLSVKMEDFLSSPMERRSAENIGQLKKSMGFSGIEDQDPKENQMRKVSILEKGKVSNILMGIYTEGGEKDQQLESAIMTYEASGFLDNSSLALVKSKGIEIIK